MKSWSKTLLLVVVPLTLALAVVAGIGAGTGSDWGDASFWGVVVLSLAVIVLGVIRLIEVRKLQQAGLRLGQVALAIALLGLFVLAVGTLFSLSCDAYVPKSFH